MSSQATLCGCSEAKLPRREVDRLQNYDWPGNVRELRNLVERAVILVKEGHLNLTFWAPVKQDRAEFYTESGRRDRERENLLKALKCAGGKVSGEGGAAELLGVNANTLASRLRGLGISRNYSGLTPATPAAL